MRSHHPTPCAKGNTTNKNLIQIPHLVRLSYILYSTSDSYHLTVWKDKISDDIHERQHNYNTVLTLLKSNTTPSHTESKPVLDNTDLGQFNGNVYCIL